jgi:hypothetical protein
MALYTPYRANSLFQGWACTLTALSLLLYDHSLALTWEGQRGSNGKGKDQMNRHVPAHSWAASVWCQTI